MNWYDNFFQAPVSALNNVRSNVWSVILIITGISLLIHGQTMAGNSLITGAFAVFRSSNTETAPVPPNAQVPTQVPGPNVERE